MGNRVQIAGEQEQRWNVEAAVEKKNWLGKKSQLSHFETYPRMGSI